jgi:hypothetical protein
LRSSDFAAFVKMMEAMLEVWKRDNAGVTAFRFSSSSGRGQQEGDREHSRRTAMVGDAGMSRVVTIPDHALHLACKCEKMIEGATEANGYLIEEFKRLPKHQQRGMLLDQQWRQRQ